MKRLLFSIIAILFLFATGCKKDETGDPNYPTTISLASAEKVNQLSTKLNNSPLSKCTTIDQFGFCTVSLKNDSCDHFDSIPVRYSKEEIVDIFHQSVFDYSDLLNLKDTLGIKVASIKNIRGIEYEKLYKTYPDSVPKDWIVTSNLQKLNGFEIPGTSITMLITYDQIRSIGGKRYEQLYIPATDVFSEESAKKSLLNVELTNNSSTIKTTTDTYWYKSEKIIFPVIKSGRIELRVCWSLYPENWQVVVDTQTGEVLSSINIDKI
jgi:hypothetical protein